MNPILKKIYYYEQIWPLIRSVKNWDQIIKLYLHRDGKVKKLKLRNGPEFFVKHYLDALTIKEIFIDYDYKMKVDVPNVVIDVGANIGTFSILQALKYPNAKIYSFEPAKSTYKLLEKNVKINKAKNITTVQKAVSNKASTLSFYSHPASGLSSLMKTRKEMRKETIHSTTLPKIFSTFKITHCDLLKMDCEGAEYEIFFSLPKAFFSKIPNIVMEYHDSLTTHHHQELITLFKGLGYKVKSRPHPVESDIGIIFAKRI